MSANFFHTHKKSNTESATRSQLVNTYRSLNHWNGFQFKQSLYPESAAKSVQNRIDYKNHTIKDA